MGSFSRYGLICLGLSLCLAGCNKTGYDEVAPVVKENIALFGETEIPGELQELLGSNRIIMLGETYYVQEHQEYVARLFDHLGPDGLIFFNEFPCAYSWLAEDYITGKIEHIPYYIRLYNQLWVEKIREINLEHGPPYPVHFIFMDVNHNRNDFKNSITESEKINGAQQLFYLIKILGVDSNAYHLELLNLKRKLEDQVDEYLDLWGETWYNRYYQLIDLEIQSHLYRTEGKETDREAFMFNVIESELQHHPELKTVINCGMEHAQKETLMGTRIKRIGAMMEEQFPGNTCSIAFVGIRGKRKFRDDIAETIDFNILETAGKDDLIRIIGEEAGSFMSFLSLEDGIFREVMDATYSAGAVRVAPGKQFDAIISYPVISVLKSLSDFNI